MEVDAPKGIWQQQKKEENYKRKKKEIGHNFLIDFLFFLFFIPHEKKSVYTYISEKWTDCRIGSRRLAGNPFG